MIARGLDERDRKGGLIASRQESDQGGTAMLFGAEHVKRYQETDGAEGHEWQGTTVLILTTTGRRSGAKRSTPLIYGESGQNLVVVASKGGAEEHPAWYENLSADPQVEVQVLAERFSGHARTATAEERPELWRLMVGRWPAYEDYRRKTSREIPVVVLERS
jgi:deazaflavin-dependent oxidoreductase (nitroreductase family)